LDRRPLRRVAGSVSRHGLVKSVATDADARSMLASRGPLQSCRVDSSCGSSLRSKRVPSRSRSGWNWSRGANKRSASCQSSKLATIRAAIRRLCFVGLLKAALSCGHAHVADRRGSTPELAEEWGWRRKPGGQEWVPQGVRIGWLTAGDQFLEPTTSYCIAQAVAGSERLPMSQQNSASQIARERSSSQPR